MNASVRRYAPAVALPLRLVAAEDGCRIAVHVLRSGSSGGTPVVFVHALAMDGLMWNAAAQALPARPGLGELLAIDCRGHGRSDDPAPPYSTARFADDIACVLDAAGAAQAHLVGCSMGGTVSLAFAARHAARVASLSVVDATAWYGPDAAAHWEARAQKALEGGMQALTEFQRARWFSPEFVSANPALVQEAVDVFLANRVPSYVATCRMLGIADERAGLAAHAGRVQVVVGEHDYATPLAMSQDIAARLPHARLNVIPQARHYTPLEAPDVVAGFVADLIAESGG